MRSAASALCLSALNGAGSLVYVDTCVPGGVSLGWQLWSLRAAPAAALPWAPPGRTYQLVSAAEQLCLQVRRPRRMGRADPLLISVAGLRGGMRHGGVAGCGHGCLVA